MKLTPETVQGIASMTTETLTAEQVERLRQKGKRGTDRVFREDLRSSLCAVCDSHEAFRAEVARLTAVTEGIKDATEERVVALKVERESLIAVIEGLRTWAESHRPGSAHTYASENADHYRGFEAAAACVLARLPAVTQTASQEKAK